MSTFTTEAHSLDIVVDPNLDGHTERVRSAQRKPFHCLDHLSYVFRFLQQARSEPFLSDPPLRATAVEVNAVANVRDELRGLGELDVVCCSELDYERTVI